jgi:hypothetical protein
MTTTSAASTSARRTQLLRPALRLDAAVTGLTGAAYLAAAPLLADLLGLSTTLQRSAGAVLLVFAVAVWLVGAGPRVRAAAVEAVIGVNVLWTIGSLVAVVTGFGSPTAVGTAWLVVQAVVVAGFAALQLVGLRRR